MQLVIARDYQSTGRAVRSARFGGYGSTRSTAIKNTSIYQRKVKSRRFSASLLNHLRRILTVHRMPSATATLSLTPAGDLVITPGPLLLTLHPNRHVVTLTLNKPSSLNALNVPVLTAIQGYLLSRDAPTLLLLRSAPPAFCAGGDIRALYNAIQMGYREHAVRFFRVMFTVTHLMSQLCGMSFWNGVVMGGGVGLSVHSSFRIATERTIWAMPEVNIGFVPDVGASWFLPRLLPGLGMYLALTASRLKAEKVRSAGLATHFVRSEHLPALIERLEVETSDRTVIENILADFDEEIREDIVHAKILDAMQEATVPKIMGKLEGLMHDREVVVVREAKETLQKMNAACPMGVVVAHELLVRGSKCSSLAECLRMEFRVCTRMIKRDDYMQGIRSVIIDKTKTAQWQPSNIDKISKASVEEFFKPLAHEDGTDELQLEGGHKQARL